MNRLDHVVKNNTNTNKDQLNDAICNQLTFDTKSFNSSSGTRDTLPVVTITLQGGKKHRAMTVAGLTCFWDSGATEIRINIKHTKYNERNIWSNKVEYSTANGVYCKTHDAKVPFCIPEFSIRKVINN